MLATSNTDHRERFFAYEKLDRYPLYVTVGLDVAERLAPFHASRIETLVMTSISSLLIVLATIALVILIGNLIDSRREAVLAAQAKLHFLSNMSHEFRTPLNGILGYSETLMEDFAGTRHGDFACAIHDSGVRLLSLVDSVLELSSLRSGKVNLILSEENLADIVRFSIIDTGCGIALAQHEKIFEKFSQVDESVTRAHGGAGLGLTIAGLLVKLMQGEIWVRSALNVGSTFSFSLPIKPLSTAETPRLVTLGKA